MPTDPKTIQLAEVIFKGSRMMREHMGFKSEVGNLSMLQMQVLLFVKQRPSAHMREIADNFKIELPSATSLIDTLSKAKLVDRKIDSRDRRIVRINLTTQGKELLAQAVKERTKKIANILSYLSNEDKSDLLRIMQKLLENLEKIYEK
jgi:DNA-binding MarR family transcriptional regulator